MFIAIGPNCWGKGDNLNQAIRRARVNWPHFIDAKAKNENFTVYETQDESAWVDDYGTLHFKTQPTKIQTSKLAVD